MDNRKTEKMSNGIENLIETSLIHNRSTPIFQTIREIPGIARRPITRHKLRLRRTRPIGYLSKQELKTKHIGYQFCANCDTKHAMWNNFWRKKLGFGYLSHV